MEQVERRTFHCDLVRVNRLTAQPQQTLGLRLPVRVNLSFILSRKLFFPRRCNSEH